MRFTALFVSALLAACASAPPTTPDRADKAAPAVEVPVEAAPAPMGSDSDRGARSEGPTIAAPAPARRATAVRFEVVAFEAAGGGAPAERVIPADLAPRAQFWPGNSGDVLEHKVGDITHLLSGDAISSAWKLSDPAAVAKADQLALRVISVEKLSDDTPTPTDAGRFARAAVESDKLPTDGRWFRIRFFPGGVWKEAQLQGYMRMGQKGPEWFRVDGLIRGLYGPQNRDYRAGDLFEFRAVDRPSGVKLYPFE